MKKILIFVAILSMIGVTSSVKANDPGIVNPEFTWMNSGQSLKISFSVNGTQERPIWTTLDVYVGKDKLPLGGPSQILSNRIDTFTTRSGPKELIISDIFTNQDSFFTVWFSVGYLSEGAGGSSFNVRTYVAGIQVIQDDPAISLYPNPSQNTVTLVTEKEGMAQILDLNGRIVKEFAVTAGENVIRHGLSPGMYTISFSSDYSISTKKLLISQ